MRFRRHLSWNNQRAQGVMESLASGDACAPVTPPTPAPRPASAAPEGAIPAEPSAPGSTTLFYRLKGLMAHKDTKVSF
jgi:hypothetical protein